MMRVARMSEVDCTNVAGGGGAAGAGAGGGAVTTCCTGVGVGAGGGDALHGKRPPQAVNIIAHTIAPTLALKSLITNKHLLGHAQCLAPGK